MAANSRSAASSSTTPNALLLQIHDRMPVVTMDGLEEIWLLPEAAAELWGLEALMVPWDRDSWKAIPVDWV
jgi:putative SOS response-associated peptidase YedK